ncbi:MAG TPA: ABC transporter ATP-binding protein [Gemmatimonadaceae bacterium]|nr:ABC transporter ATP-binding protein [Gemmatimonadaceae bacterium]
MYKIFSSRSGRLIDALGLPGKARASYREFWALRGIDFTLDRGERIGIIGRNGAGKSTLLRLITQNIEPTEGTLRVGGDVQALLETGGGLHPEFTGYENIRASLSFLGLRPKEITEAERGIAEFTELGRFLDQPFKTYSTGMQARLAFAIATTIRPEILIVDEVLGAGDAYFFAKSSARMRELLDSGAAVLLVSHALDQVVRFCTEAIWIDRGRIVDRGPSTEIVKSYEKFVRQLEDRRLRARNEKSLSSRYDAFERESYTDHILVTFEGAFIVWAVELTRDGQTEDSVDVGGPQDADPAQSASVVLDSSTWSAPSTEAGDLCRRVETSGSVLFHLWLLHGSSAYAVRVRACGRGTLTGRHGTTILCSEEFESDGPAWFSMALDTRRGQGSTGLSTSDTRVSRWPGEQSLLIERVHLESDGTERAVFAPGESMSLYIEARSHATGQLPVTPAATIYRSDGILATNFVGQRFDVDVRPDQLLVFRLGLESLNLGDGLYLASVALYRRLAADAPQVYDLLDRSYEFEVRGNEVFDNGVFRHDAEWTVKHSSPVGSSADLE